MKTLSRWFLALALVLSSVIVNSTATPVSASATIADHSIALLPKSDVVAVLDVSRLVNDLLPKAKQAWPEQVAKMEKEIDQIFSEAAKNGVDLYKVKSLAIGLKLFGAKTTGAMIVDGLTVTPEMMAKENKESTAVDYKGKTLYIEKPKPEPKTVRKSSAKTVSKRKPLAASKRSGKARTAKAAPPVSNNPLGNMTDVASMGANLLKDNTAYVQLDESRAAIGDETEVKAVIDALLEGANPAHNLDSELSAALQETKSTGLLRFAMNIPDSARQAAEGEAMFKNLAVTKMVLGTLDVTDDMSVALDTRLRTGSTEDATKLHESLAALLGLGKMMVGGNQEPMMAMLSKVLDQIRISPQTNDVALTITIPRELYETFLKSDPKVTPAKNDK
jgi:hypothetical protein